MARSKFLWLVVFDDYTVQYFRAQSIEQIIESDKLYDDLSYVVNINRIELDLGGYDESVIDIDFVD